MLVLTHSRKVQATDISLHVHELLRLETERALQLSKQELTSPNNLFEAVSIKQEAPPELLAIYGQGKNFLAEVRYQQKNLLFKQGHVAAIGRHQSGLELRLQRMDSHCVQLVFQQEPLRLCMER